MRDSKSKCKAQREADMYDYVSTTPKLPKNAMPIVISLQVDAQPYLISSTPQAYAHTLRTFTHLLQPFLVPTLHLIHRALPFLTPRRRFVVLNMHHAFPLHALHALFPLVVVLL